MFTSLRAQPLFSRTYCLRLCNDTDQNEPRPVEPVEDVPLGSSKVHDPCCSSRPSVSKRDGRPLHVSPFKGDSGDGPRLSRVHEWTSGQSSTCISTSTCLQTPVLILFTESSYTKRVLFFSLTTIKILEPCKGDTLS